MFTASAAPVVVGKSPSVLRLHLRTQIPSHSDPVAELNITTSDMQGKLHILRHTKVTFLMLVFSTSAVTVRIKMGRRIAAPNHRLRCLHRKEGDPLVRSRSRLRRKVLRSPRNLQNLLLGFHVDRTFQKAPTSQATQANPFLEAVNRRDELQRRSTTERLAMTTKRTNQRRKEGRPPKKLTTGQANILPGPRMGASAWRRLWIGGSGGWLPPALAQLSTPSRRTVTPTVGLTLKAEALVKNSFLSSGKAGLIFTALGRVYAAYKSKR